jgi:hypothetical protein
VNYSVVFFGSIFMSMVNDSVVLYTMMCCD